MKHHRPDMWIVQKQSESMGWIVSDWYLSEEKAHEAADSYDVPTNVVFVDGEPQGEYVTTQKVS